MGESVTKSSIDVNCLKAGTILNDRYEIEKTVGEGGFGIVYMARDNALEINVAIKEFFVGRLCARKPGERDVEVKGMGKIAEEYTYRRQRFLTEARNLAKFSKHKNIVNVYDYFEENNTAYLVMEYLEGISLSAFLKQNKGKISEENAVEIAEAVSQALSAMHKEKIYHLDVAPDNIFLCPKNVIKLIDFGAAKFGENEETVKDVILKPGFSPAEQYINNGKVGAYSDIYALSATLYRAVTGVKPPESTNRKMFDTLREPKDINPEFSQGFSDALMKGLRMEPELRFQKIEDFMAALRGNKKVRSKEKELRIRKIRNITAVGLTLAAVIAAVMLIFFRKKQNDENESHSLAEASFTLMICADEGSDKENAFRELAENFSSANSGVTIEVLAVNEAEYVAKLAELSDEGKLPELFETVEAEDSGISGLRTSEIISDDIISKCSFLADYESYYGNKNNIFPLCFTLPVAAVITSGEVELDYASDYFTSVADFACDYAVTEDNAELMEKNFGKEVISVAQSREDFYADRTSVYLSTTLEMREIKEAMQSYGHKFVFYDSDNLKGEYTLTFALGEGSDEDEAAAEAFLTGLYDAENQKILTISMLSDGQLPLNDACFEEKCKMSDYAPLFSLKEKIGF